MPRIVWSGCTLATILGMIPCCSRGNGCVPPRILEEMHAALVDRMFHQSTSELLDVASRRVVPPAS